MKPLSLSENGLPAQIWNSAPQLDNIPVINTHTLVPPGDRKSVV